MRWIIACGLALLTFGCGDSTSPGPGPSVPATFVGNVDPPGGEFVLDRAEIAVPGGVPIPVELVGSGLEVDATYGLVQIDVALRNAGSLPLHPPAEVWVGGFLPATVRVTNANIPTLEPFLTRWGFDYGDLLGDDDVLSPGETSEARRWHFHDPGLEPFSFDAEVVMGLAPPPALIGGAVFADANQNGIRERNEGPWPYGILILNTPDGTQRAAWCAEDGSYRFIVEEAGLYRVRLESLVDCIVCFTTPNPVEVMLTPGADGEPVSFLMAGFGAICGPCDDPRD